MSQREAERRERRARAAFDERRTVERIVRPRRLDPTHGPPTFPGRRASLARAPVAGSNPRCCFWGGGAPAADDDDPIAR